MLFALTKQKTIAFVVVTSGRICLDINLTDDRDYIRQDLYCNEKFFAYVNSNIHVLADILLIVLSS